MRSSWVSNDGSCAVWAPRQFQAICVLLLLLLVMLGAGWFLTKHRELVMASVQRELVLRTIFESEPACMMLLARDNTVIEMNPGALAMIEADSIEAVKGQGLPDCACAQDTAPSAWLRALRSETGLAGHTFHQRWGIPRHILCARAWRTRG